VTFHHLVSMNENQQRHLVVTFRYVDELLSDAEQIMASAGSASPFQKYSQDTTPVQRKVMHDYCAGLRETMRQDLEMLGIPPGESISGALWAARGKLMFAQVAVEDLAASKVTGYGPLTDIYARALDRIVAGLNAHLARIAEYLAMGEASDLQARLSRLEKTTGEIKLLRELERIISAHGLVEFRGTLTMLLDRLENPAFEIGIFGRVSSGKSSLLNHLLGSEVLPVGVTPVTALPTRISFGASPRVVIEFADRPPLSGDLALLPEFATEQQNPGNAKHVSGIRVQVPAAILREGITFVDTPGIGSLAVSGAEETAAYLPRCDLGIVLVDAASTLTHEDLKIIQTIYQSGATAMVLVSKVDMLSLADRQRAVDYLKQKILAEVNVEPPVHLISVVGSDAKLCEEWFDRMLLPMLDAHRELVELSLKRKIGGLREVLLASLRRRAAPEVASRSASETARIRELADGLGSIPQILEAGRREADATARELRTRETLVINDAAEGLVAVWLGNDPQRVNPAEIVSATLSRLIADESGKVRQQVEQTRVRLAGILQDAAREFPATAPVIQSLPNAAGLPVSDLSSLSGAGDLGRPAVLSLFGTSALRWNTRARLEARIRPAVHAVLEASSRNLELWAKKSLSELETAVSASSGVFKAQFTRPQPESSGTSIPGADNLQQDILLLERWEPQTHQDHDSI